MTQVTHHDVDLGDVILHCITAGQGFPLVLVHGCPQTSHEWRYVMPALAEKYFVIAPDLRGLGDSSRPAGGYDKKTMSEDIWRLMQSMQFDRFFLAGHDWGGPVAFSLAARHPDAVRRLAILDVVIPGDGGDFSQGGRRWHHALFRTPDLPEQLFIGREHLILDWLFDNYGYLNHCIADEDRKEYLRTYVKPGAMRALFSMYRTLPQDAEDNRALLESGGKLRMPVLGLGGDRSYGRGMEVIDSLKRVADDVRGGIVTDCGHWLPEEKPEVVAASLLEFFGEEDPLAPSR